MGPDSMNNPAFEKALAAETTFLGTNSLSGKYSANPPLTARDDKSVMIEVDLVSNNLSGPLPASLCASDCRFTLQTIRSPTFPMVFVETMLDDGKVKRRRNAICVR
jgi:hypothetical protein